MQRGPAIVITCICLALSFVLMRVQDKVAHPGDVIDQALRRALVLTVLFYVVVGVALAVYCTVARVGLVWFRGSLPDALVLGLPLGLAGGFLAVGLNSAINGHLSSDPNVEALVGGGGGLRIALTLVVTAALAPLIEETLFRGVLAGTLLAGGTALALCGSAFAFAVWHMNLVSLRYYFLMGLVFGWLWLRRGLVSSMVAHAAFNGVLTLAAVAATSGSGHVTHYERLAFSVPGGWHTVSSGFSGHLVVSGPAGALLEVESLPADPGVTLSASIARLPSEESFTAKVVAGTQHDVSVPGGEAVTADLLIAGQPGHLCLILSGGRIYQLLMITSGSPGAERNWRHVLATSRIE
jgi:membrane protease YdiL (CAAX protease family)